MAFKNSFKWAIGTIIFLGLVQAASAESYVGVQVGGRFANKVSGVKGDVVGVPNPAAPFIPGSPAYLAPFTGTDSSDLKLDETISIGAKVGHYFDKMPFLGVEGDINFSQPDLYPQNLTFSNPAFPPTLPQQSQKRIKIQDFQGGVSLMARYPAWKRVMPYVGVGPQVHLFRLRGSGDTQNPFALGAFGPGRSVKQDKIGIGLQAKAGVRLAITKHLAIDAEYKFNFSPVRFEARNLDNLKGTLTSHEVGAALVYRFGNIKW